jgi:hypothetical protein
MGFLTNLILLIEHEKGEPNRFSKVYKNFQNPIINVFILYFIFIIIIFFSFTNFRALHQSARPIHLFLGGGHVPMRRMGSRDPFRQRVHP